MLTHYVGCVYYPLCVTSVWRRPSLRNMSTTVSIGVWSVTVMGAMSKMRCSFSGGSPPAPPAAAPAGGPPANSTRDWPVMPSTSLRAFAAYRLF